MKIRINWKIVFDALLGLFALCGFCPTLVSPKEKSKLEIFNIILALWSLGHFVAAIALAYEACAAFVRDDPEIASFNNILKFSIMTSTHIVACVESFVVRKNFVEIWSRVKQVDDLIGNMLHDYNSLLMKFYKGTTLKIISCIVITALSESIIIFNIVELKSWAFMWCISCVPLSMSRLRHLQHSLYTDLLTFRFRIIKKELKSIVKLTRLDDNKLVNKNYNFYSGLFTKINTIKSVYNILWETSLFMNRSFGLSQLCNLLQNFVHLTCDLYLVYSFLYKNNLTYIIGEVVKVGARLFN